MPCPECRHWHCADVTTEDLLDLWGVESIEQAEADETIDSTDAADYVKCDACGTVVDRDYWSHGADNWL